MAEIAHVGGYRPTRCWPSHSLSEMGRIQPEAKRMSTQDRVTRPTFDSQGGCHLGPRVRVGYRLGQCRVSPAPLTGEVRIVETEPIGVTSNRPLRTS